MPPAVLSAADSVVLADQLEGDGRFREAAQALEQIDRHEREPLVDVRIVHLRHRAFREVDRSAPVDRPTDPPADRFPDTLGAPEVGVEELDAELLRAALHHHGCLIVRGLLDPETCDRTRADIDAAFEEYDGRFLKPVEATAPWFAALDAEKGYEPLDPLAGAFLREGGGVYAPFAPRAFVEYRHALAEAGVIDVIAEHLGELPVVSVNKCVLRRVQGGAQPSWHQDAIYLGTQIRAVNLWVSLTRCGGGTDVMGLDILPGPLGELATSGTHDAIDPRAVSQHVVDELASATGRPIARPTFDPGDAILFDQLFLHRSDTRPLPAVRHAVEAWFFAPSTYPDHQIPVVAG